MGTRGTREPGGGKRDGAAWGVEYVGAREERGRAGRARIGDGVC